MTNSKILGNEAFKLGDYKKAIKHYTEGLKELTKDTDLDERYKCLNNRAQCYLKINEFENAYIDANEVLKFNTIDYKALFRRSQASKGLNRFDEALIDAKRLVSYEPKNEAFLNHMKSLVIQIQNKATEQNAVNSKAKNMLELATTSKGEQQTTALNNLIVLARENDGANEIISNNGLAALSSLLDRNEIDIKLSVIRILSSMTKNSFKRSLAVYTQLKLSKILLQLADKDDSIATATAVLVQNILLALTSLEEKRKTKKKINVTFDFSDDQKQYINEIFTGLTKLINNPDCSGYGRDNSIDLCLKYVDVANGCGWTLRFIEQGLPKLLDVAACVEGIKNTLTITPHTKMHAACCLSIVHDDLYSDKQRDDYRAICDTFISNLCDRNDDISKLRAISSLAVLLQGPFDVGNAIIGKNNLIEMMLSMAESNDLLQQKTAVEAVVFSASKKDKASGILDLGFNVIKKLYMSENLDVKVRALVGLCKLASSKGSDSSIKLLADGSILKLERACTKLLTNPTSTYDTKKWAADGLSYLTLDAEVKDELVNDALACKELFELAKRDDKNTLYSIATIFANVCNVKEVKKIDPEMVELARYAKQHIPEEHEKDKEAFFLARRQKLMDYDIAPVLVTISKYNSSNCREHVANIFACLCKEAKNHGAIVACGAAKALINLASEGTDGGKAKASKALAEIAIAINPEIAFPGQRCVEVVRPMIHLLHPDRSTEENLKALMALTNLAQVDSTVRKAMIKDSGFNSIEAYVFEQHEALRVAAVECVCNLVQEPDVVALFEKPGTDRVKLLVLYCGEEDLRLNIAASGALALLSDENEVICQKILDVQAFTKIFKECACTSDIGLQHRIFFILNNIVSINKELCARIVETELMEVIVALTKLKVEKEREKVKKLAIDITKKAMEYDLIKPTSELYLDERDEDELNE